MTINELLEKITEKFNEKDLSFVEIFSMDIPEDAGHLEPDEALIVAEIVWGDWKHVHAYTNQLMEAVLKENNISLLDTHETVTEQDGSDCYSANHYFIVGGLEITSPEPHL